MALKGLRVIELAGLAPGPFCGLILADLGAKVIRVDRLTPGLTGGNDHLSNGKLSVSVDLKKKEGANVVRRLCSGSDVVIEPFRRGVMEKLGLGPDQLLKDNPRLVYARLTGYGQSGTLADRAGHDINYLAISGVLSMLGRKDDNPYAPVNIVADFAGGGLLCAMGILTALYQRNQSGRGQVIDASMVEGAAYVSRWLWTSKNTPIWTNPRGQNWLDGGAHFYDTYKTSDAKYMAVGAIEPQFYAKLLEGLGLTADEAPQFGNFDDMRELFAKTFASKTQAEWCKIFDNVDACVTPVLTSAEAAAYGHNKERRSFLWNSEGQPEPNRAPVYSDLPQLQHIQPPAKLGEHTEEILKDCGFTPEEIQSLKSHNVVFQREPNSKL